MHCPKNVLTDFMEVDILTFAPQWCIGADSSAEEHLPYKQGVTGSNPVSPTRNLLSSNNR